MNLARSAAAVLIGAILIIFMHGTLEQTLVRALAGVELTSQEAFIAARNRPVVLVVSLVTFALISTLGGYILAKIAGANEVAHAVATAIVLMVLFGYAFTRDNALLPPGWVRIVMLIVTAPALIAGAAIRAEARTIHQQVAAERPEERS